MQLEDKNGRIFNKRKNRKFISKSKRNKGVSLT